MSHFFSFTRNQSVILLTILLVLILGALYLFVYMPGNQRDLEEQRFRYLGKIETNIHTKIENSIGLLNNQLVSFAKDSSNFDNKRLIQYIAKYPRTFFTLIPIDTLPNPRKVKQDSVCTVALNKEELTILLSKKKYEIGMRYTPKQFIDSLLPRNIFDQFVILKKDTIIYQTFPIGVTGIFKDSLQSDKSAFKTKQVRDIVLGGTPYKMFVQNLVLNNQAQLTLVGLLSRKNYDYEKSKLPENIVLCLLVIATAAIFSMPWIKLYQMGNQDRLTVTDCLFSFGVSTMLMSLFFFGFFKYNVFFLPGKDPSDSSKRYLAKVLDGAFTAEISKAHQKLVDLNRLRETYAVDYNIVNFGSKKAAKVVVDPGYKTIPVSLGDSVELKKITSDNSGLSINQLFWLREDGYEKINWTTSKENTPPGNFGNRDYFRMLKEDRTFQLRDELPPFYLDQVVSWTTGRFTSVLSQKFTKGTELLYGAISLNLQSVGNAVMPAGFTYSIINKHGKVLYNSKPSKNLNEEMFEEFSEDQKLRAAVQSNSEKIFKTKYLGKEYTVLVKPLKSLPYYVVILELTAIKNIRDIKIFGFTFLMQTAFFFFLVFQFLAVYAFAQKKNFFTKRYVDISWVGPNENLIQVYNSSILWNVLTILILCIFFNIAGFFQFLFMLLFSVVVVPLFLNYGLSKYYKKTHNWKYELKDRAKSALWVTLILVTIAAVAVLGWDWFFLGEAIWLGLGFLIYSHSDQILASLRSAKKRLSNTGLRIILFHTDFSHSFSLMVFTRLIISCGIPILFFYMAAFDYETKLISRYRHTRFVDDVVARTPPSNSKLNFSGAYADNVWIKDSILTHVNTKPPAECEDLKSSLFDILTSYNIAGVNELYRYSPRAKFVYLDTGSACVTETIYTSDINPKWDIQLSTTSLPCQLPNLLPINKDGVKGLFYWCIFGVSLALFYYAMHLVLRKLFALSLPKQTGWEKIDEVILTDNNLNSLLFIIGSPGSGILDEVKKYIQQGKIKGKNNDTLINDQKEIDYTKVFVADLIIIPDEEGDVKDNKDWNKLKRHALEKNYSLIIIKNFDYDLKNYSTTRMKLNFIEALLHRNASKIIITSTVHPVNFLESLNQQNTYKVKEGKKDGEEKTQDQRSPMEDMERWHVALGHFKIIIKKLETSTSDVTGLPVWQQLLVSETQSGHFLQKLKTPLLNGLKEIETKTSSQLVGENLAFKMQINSHYFYMYMWQSLTKEEKFLLYDLAEDGLVNPFDDYNLTMLISKGLIVPDEGGLRIFNRAFRNFILTAIGTSEAMMIRTQITDNGNWNQLKTPLVIMIVAVFAFLFASQQEAYYNVIKYISILAAAIPTTLKFFDLFTKNNSKNG